MSYPVERPAAVPSAPPPDGTQYRPQPSGGPSSSGRRLLGLVLLLPALLALTWSYVLPTLSTVLTSLQRTDPLGRNAAEPVGGENYRQVFTDGLAGQVGFALLLALLPLALALLVAPALALLADRAGRVARLVTRGVLALPVAGYAPVALLLGWREYRLDPAGLAEDPRAALLGVVAATSFGLVVAVATTAYLSALRRRTPGLSPGPALLTVAGFLGLGVLAMAIQVHTAPALLTLGGPEGTTTTPLLHLSQSGFVRMQFGAAAAVGTLLLVLLGVLGLGALGLLLATRARIEFDGWGERPAAPAPTSAAGAGPGRRGFLAAVGLTLLVFLGLYLWASAPWLRDAAPGAELPGDLSTGRVLVNTWLPPLLPALVSVGLAALAGFGIGALRPLGRWSELLLLPFAPWLFVGFGPLVVAHFERTRELDQLDSFLGLTPPSWLCVPALFALTLLFRGQHGRWQPGDGLGRTLVLPALPMLALAVLLTWLVNAQQSLWSFAVATDLQTMPAPLLAQAMASQGPGLPDGLLGLVLPLALVLLLVVAFAALQVGYLDRLAIRVGRTAAGGEANSSPPAVAG
ncbi:sugar ABC transporter permease [Plantactinospora sp. CA-290183]|uniref:sugar ABC transporter permease n=1 Tax=Plantactinospora sp. CA-290183 TaxID=3240006 RepID=UPI003D933ABC